MPTKKSDKANYVLVVEDEPALSDIFANVLKAGGFEVEQAYDGVEGLDKALHKRPDAILLDLLMPMKDGFDTLKDLKSHESTADIPVIILSNLGQDFEKRRGLELGAKCFFTKTDFDQSKLAQVVERIIAGGECNEPLE